MTISGPVWSGHRISGPVWSGPRISGPIETRPRISGPIWTPSQPFLGEQIIVVPPPADDVLTLIAALGGNAAVLAMYDVRDGVTSSGGVVDSWRDYRGAAGFAPALTAIGTLRPLFTGTGPSDWLVSFDGGDDRLSTGLSSLFDISGAASLIFVGSLESAALTKLIASITRLNGLGGSHYWMAIGTPASGGNEWAGRFNPGGAEATPTTGVAVAATRRVAFAGKPSGAGTWSIEVPNAADATASLGAIGSQDFELTLGALDGVGGIAAAVGTARACIVLNRLYTAGDATTIRDWAIANHAAVAA